MPTNAKISVSMAVPTAPASAGSVGRIVSGWTKNRPAPMNSASGSSLASVPISTVRAPTLTPADVQPGEAGEDGHHETRSPGRRRQRPASPRRSTTASALATPAAPNTADTQYITPARKPRYGPNAVST